LLKRNVKNALLNQKSSLIKKRTHAYVSDPDVKEDGGLLKNMVHK